MSALTLERAALIMREAVKDKSGESLHSLACAREQDLIRLLRGEINTKEYVALIKQRVAQHRKARRGS